MNNRILRHISALLLVFFVTCTAASEDSEKAVNVTINSQLEKLLSEFESMETNILGNKELPNGDQLDLARSMLQEIQGKHATYAKSGSVSSSAQVQIAGPSRAVEPNRAKPSQEDIEKMQKATEQSHLSGPPIKDAQAGAVSPQRVDVFSISLETVIEKLDSIEIELEKGQPDTMKIVSDLRQGQASLKQAQKNIECPD